VSIYDKESVHIVVRILNGTILSGKTNYHCKVKKTLIIQYLQPALNANGAVESFYVLSTDFPLFTLQTDSV